MNPAYRSLQTQQLTAQQLQQLSLQGLNPSQMNNPQFQQLHRAGLLGAGQPALPQNMAALMRPQAQPNRAQAAPAQLNKSFPGKLTQIKEFPIEKSREMLQEILKVVLYKGNSGHQEVLRTEGKCG